MVAVFTLIGSEPSPSASLLGFAGDGASPLARTSTRPDKTELLSAHDGVVLARVLGLAGDRGPGPPRGRLRFRSPRGGPFSLRRELGAGPAAQRQSLVRQPKLASDSR